VPDTTLNSRQRALAITALQVVIVLVALFLMGRGHSQLAIALLVVPIQLCLMLLISGSSSNIMRYIVVLLPASMFELLPYVYMHLAVYAGGIILLSVVAPTAGSDDTARKPKTGTGNTVPLALFAVAVVLAAANAYLRGWAGADLPRYCFSAGLFLGAVWLFGARPESSKEVRRLLDLMMISYAVIGIALPLVAYSITADMLSEIILSAHGAVNRNVVGAHASTAASYLLVRAVLERRWGARVLRVLLLCVPLVVLVFTGSRGAWLGFGASFLYLVFVVRSVWLFWLSLTFGSVLITGDIVRALVMTRVQATGAVDPSLLGRLLLWRFGLVVGLNNWLTGVGFLNFRHVKHSYGFPWPRAVGLPYNTHNLYLEFFTSLGIVGLVAFVWLLMLGIVAAHKSRYGLSGRLRPESIGIAAMLIGVAVHGMLDAVIWQHGMLMLLGVLLGLAGALRRLNGRV